MGVLRQSIVLFSLALCLVGLGCNSSQKNSDPAKPAVIATPTSGGPKPPQWPPVPGAVAPGPAPISPTTAPLTGTPTSQVVQGTITGVVMDRQQRRPNNAFVQIVDLQEANISGQETSKFEVSADALGNFTVQGLKLGKTYQLTARVRDRSILYTGTAVVAAPSSQVVIEIQEDTATNQPTTPASPSMAPLSAAPDTTDTKSGAATSTIKPERIARDLGMMPSSMPTLSIPPTKLVPSNSPSTSGPQSRGNLPDAPVPSCQLVGRKLENFALVDIDGNAWEFRKHKTGRLTLIDFWFSTCGPCLTAIPHLVTLQRTYKAYGFEVVGIAYEKGSIPERAAKVKSVRGRYGLNYTTLLGQIGSEECPVRTQFQVTSFPTLVLVDEMGNLLWRSPSDRGLNEATLRELEMEIRRGLGMSK